MPEYLKLVFKVPEFGDTSALVYLSSPTSSPAPLFLLAFLLAFTPPSPSCLSSFKTQKGCGFLHHSQVLLLVYCQDFTMAVLVWPGLSSRRRTDLTLGRGVTDAQLYTSIQPPSACLTAFSCITNSSVSMQNPQQCCKHSFLPLETTPLKGSRSSLWKLDPLQKHVEKTAVP